MNVSDFEQSACYFFLCLCTLRKDDGTGYRPESHSDDRAYSNRWMKQNIDGNFCITVNSI